MTVSPRRIVLYGFLAPVVLICGAAVAVYATGTDLDDFWLFCREANVYLAIIAAIGVTARLVMMMLDRKRWGDYRGIHLMTWFLYIILGLVNVYAGAVYYDAVEAPASWPSGMRTLLNLMAISLSIWWPHPRRINGEPAHAQG